MKRQALGIAALVLLAGLAGWLLSQRSGNVNRSDRGIQVMTSLPILRNLAEIVGGKEVNVDSIIRGTACAHEYEPTPGDMKQVAKCAIFVKAGMGFDTWADRLLKSAGNESAEIIDASFGVTIIKDGHEYDLDGEQHNPHYWGSPENVKVMAGNILAGLVEVRPERKQYFTANYENFIARLDKAIVALRAKVAGLANRRIVSYSACFPYFYTYFGFDNLATVETTCEQEVAPKRLAAVAKLMREKHIRIIVGEEVYPRLPESLARETGAKVVLLWPTTNDSGDCLETIRANVEKMVSALNAN